jgi:TatD DNase family protein
MFIDTHCHLDRDFFKESDTVKVVERARKENVLIIVTNGTTIERNREALELAKRFKEVKAALGIHPSEIDKITDSEIDKEIEFIKANKDKIIGIGEVGLDFKEENIDKERQIKVFKKFIKLAREINKPIIVHSRKAEKECIELLEKENYDKVIMHCFSGKKQLYERIIDKKWLITIPASIKYNEQFKLIAESFPLELMLCETDAPFLHPDRGMNNEPKNVIEGYKKIAEIKKLKIEEVEKQIEHNFKKMFMK